MITRFILALLIVLIGNQKSFTQTFEEIRTDFTNEPQRGARFGSSIDQHGNYLIAGSYTRNQKTEIDSAYSAGAAFIYEKTGTGWKQVAKLSAPDLSNDDYFGYSVKIFKDIAVAGAIGAKTDLEGKINFQISGAVYIYKRSNTGEWNFLQKLISPEEGICKFGSALAVDSGKIVVGGPANETDENGNNILRGAGAVYIYRTGSDSKYYLQQKLVHADRHVHDNFGTSLTLSGKQVLVGCSGDDAEVDGDIEIFAGSVFVYQENSEGKWVENQKITASDKKYNFQFGKYLDSDDNTLAVCSFGNNAVYTFIKESNGYWKEIQKIREFESGSYIRYGYPVSVKGNYMIVGASPQSTDLNEENWLTASGAVYVYNFGTGHQWSRIQRIVPKVRMESGNFGHAVEMGEGEAFVTSGIPYQGEERYLANAGALHFFNMSSIISFLRNEISGNLNLEIYPNPSCGDVYLRCFEWEMVQSIEVINSEGKLISPATALKKEEHLLISEAKEGLYFVKVRMKDGQSFISKVLKRGDCN